MLPEVGGVCSRNWFQLGTMPSPWFRIDDKSDVAMFVATYDYYNECGHIKGFSMRRSKVGCRTKQGLEGGFETVGFKIKDIYNAIEKQRRVSTTDAEEALKFLSGLKSIDCGIFWKYSLDCDKRLQNLFWCNGTSCYDYSVFGDVLGFDSRNAIANVGWHGFLWNFHLCLMGDLKVDEFERIWTDSMAEFALENHPWIVDMYGRKHSWFIAHIRGTYFAGLKRTSRCEALNMKIGKFIHNRYNLREFVEHFQHYLEFVRRRELVAGYKSEYGYPLVKIKLETIEQFTVTIYTKEVFELFQKVLMLASNVRVVSTKRTSACILFETKRAKQPSATSDRICVGEILNAAYMSMHAAILEDCMELVNLSCRFFDDYFHVNGRNIAKG
ncbi:hypothetical protein Ahy_A05g024019 [Arachis hypogaea]|uniref:Uncharacterized protein n=1 Tax=Arachis hypogaea TaxID=3818 RepID=A0A445D5C1_ARAHY|nr:hypothetical protein Ahy_A05g024019 [Arachis hypogaea]